MSLKIMLLKIMSLKIFPDAFSKRLKPCSNVKERRFSAASSVPDDMGFSPGYRPVRLSRAPQPARRVLTGALLALLTLSLFSPFSARAQKPAQPNVTADLPPGPMQAKATTACLECHEARIILQQRLSKAAWTKEVEKMTKWGAVVDPADRDALIDYLSLNFSPDKPAYQPQRTTNKVSK
jgi:hypothetical protein